MEWNGYTGNILEVNLTTNHISVEEENPDELKMFIGGMGMNCKLGADLIKPKIDPLSPNNPIIIGAGPLIGTITPGSSRIVALSKFPASDAIANVCGSMSFAFQLKHAGYDHLILTGQADRPVYLEILNNQVELRDAQQLWGKDIVETTDFLHDKYGSCGVVAIGPAGENLVKSALTLVDKTATFGRGGLGAIMGSKNLKAIITKGSQGISIANPQKFNELFKKLFERIRKYPQRPDWHKLGILRNAPIAALLGASGQRKKAKQAGERNYLKKLKKRRFACPSCPMGDKDLLEIKEGEFAGLLNYTSSVINPLLLLLLLKNIETSNEIVKAFDQMNRYGLDAFNIAELIDFFTTLYEKGIFTKEMTGIEWKRDFTTLMQLTEMVAKRIGFGDVLADGWNKVIEMHPDIEKDMVVIKGLEQVFDPRLVRLGTMEFEQVVNPRGAHVSSGGSPTYFSSGARPLESFTPHFYRMGIPEPAFDRIFTPPVKEMGLNVGRLTRYAEDWYTVLSSLGLCARAQLNRFWGLESATAFYNAVTGFDLDPEDLRIDAERIWNLQKILNAREGFSRKDDKFPTPWFQPLQFGDVEVKFQDFYGATVITREIAEQLLNDYYDERGWDKKTGLPSQEKIEELGLKRF